MNSQRRHIRWMAVVSALLLLQYAMPAPGGEPPDADAPPVAAALDIGSPAPEFKPAKWLQGDPVTAFEKTKTYLVECWATRHAPCLSTIPHINDLHNRFKDKSLVVVGMDILDDDADKVAEFVKGKGDKMSYRIAFDGGREGLIFKNWLQAAGATNIPYSFVIKDSKIAWHGHQSELDDALVQSMLDGTYDPKKVLDERKARQEAMGKIRAFLPDLQAKMKAGKWDEALAVADQIEKAIPARDQKMVGANVRSEIYLQKKDFEGANKQFALLSDSQPDNAQLQNQIAWQMTTDKRLGKPDLELAEKCASRSNTAAKGEDPAILDTLARVKFMQGKKDDAVKLQEQAVAKMEDKDAKEQLGKTLESYKKGELPAVEQPPHEDQEN